MAKLHDIEVDDYLAQCVTMDPLQLEEEFVQLPATLAYWNERYAETQRSFLRAKVDRERSSARLTMECRAQIEAKKGKATVSDVEAAVDGHPDYMALKDAELDAEIETRRVYGVLDAIRAKKEMLISLGAHIRAEMQSDPTLRDQARTRGGRD